MTEQLFRQEAVEFSTRRLYGHVVVLPRISHVAIFGFIAVCLAMLVATLLIGVHVERQTIPGKLAYSTHEAGERLDVQLFAPRSLVHELREGERIELRLPELDPSSIGPLSARIDWISDDVRIAAAGDSKRALVYTPVFLQIDPMRLSKAGLPTKGDYELRVETEVVIGEKSWMRWLLDSVTEERADRVASDDA